MAASATGVFRRTGNLPIVTLIAAGLTMFGDYRLDNSVWQPYTISAIRIKLQSYNGI